MSLFFHEEHNFHKVVETCVEHGEKEFHPAIIQRAVGVYKDDVLSGFLLTIEGNGVRSFHGYNFTKGNHWEALVIARRYIKQENLKFSMSVTRATTSFLKRLGFVFLFQYDGVGVMQKLKDNRGFAAFPLAINAIIAAVAGAGIAEGINALSSSSKNSQPPALPATPSLDTAQSTAQQAQTQQRQAALASGGNTNITGGTGIILGSDVSSLTLVGSS